MVIEFRSQSSYHDLAGTHRALKLCAQRLHAITVHAAIEGAAAHQADFLAGARVHHQAAVNAACTA